MSEAVAAPTQRHEAPLGRRFLYPCCNLTDTRWPTRRAGEAKLSRGETLLDALVSLRWCPLTTVMLVTNVGDMDRWNRTHEALRRAAWSLFAERGYEATATAEIAERAGVSEMTLFRHFSTKEALLLADQFDPSMAEAVRARPVNESSMRALAAGIRQAWAHVSAEEAEVLRDRLRIIAEAPGLRGGIERNSEKTVAALERALIDRGAREELARVAATAVIAGLSAALLNWARSEHAALDDTLSAALDTLGGE